MKKIFFLAVFSCLAIFFLVGVAKAAQGDRCCVAGTCGAPPSGQVYTCVGVQVPCSLTVGTNTGACSLENIGGTGGAIAKSPAECFQLRADVKIKGNDGEDVTYEKGVILADKVLANGICTLNNGVAIDAKCSDKASDDKVAKDEPCYTGDVGIIMLLGTIFNITNWLFYILMLAVTLMIIYGGFLYITAAGDPEKAGKGKSVLTFAIIGLVIALLAKIIPSVVKYIIGVA
jgi:hypothetical protein